MPQSAAGCRIDPPVSEPSASGVMPAATATAEPPLDPPGMRSSGPRIPRRAERGVLGRRSHRELVAVGLADDDRAGRFEPLDDRRVVRRHERLEDLRRGRRPDTSRADVVLERDGHAGQRPIAPARPIAIERRRPLERLFRGDGVEGVQSGLGCVDRGERRLADVDRGSIARADGVAESRERVRGCSRPHPMTRGTLNRPASRAGSGALASASRRSSDGRTPSSRSAACEPRRRWRSAGRRSCRSAAPGRRTRGCRRAGGRTGPSSDSSSSSWASAAIASTCARLNEAMGRCNIRSSEVLAARARPLAEHGDGPVALTVQRGSAASSAVCASALSLRVTMTVRRAAVAGTWYPDPPKRCARRSMDTWLRPATHRARRIVWWRSSRRMPG